MVKKLSPFLKKKTNSVCSLHIQYLNAQIGYWMSQIPVYSNCTILRLFVKGEVVRNTVEWVFTDNTLIYNILDIASIAYHWECLFIEVFSPKYDL